MWILLHKICLAVYLYHTNKSKCDLGYGVFTLWDGNAGRRDFSHRQDSILYGILYVSYEACYTVCCMVCYMVCYTVCCTICYPYATPYAIQYSIQYAILYPIWRKVATAGACLILKLHNHCFMKKNTPDHSRLSHEPYDIKWPKQNKLFWKRKT